MSERTGRRPLDPRLYQIGALSLLLAYGMTALAFDVTPRRAALLVATALATQYACTRIWGLPSFEPRSALVSGLSLCLLLRTDGAPIAAAGAALAVGSKFLLRWNGKHVFNPTNFGLAAAVLATGRAWVSPGQWGAPAFFGFLIACAGGLVVTRAARADVTIAFLAGYAGLLLARSAWLGEPASIPLHRLQSGALLLFSFFMISDPKTTPDSREGRILFGLLVAFAAAFVQFRLFRANGPIWALFALSPLTPLIDRLIPGRRYDWAFPKGVSDETRAPFPGLVPLALRGEPAGPPVLRVLRGQGRRETL
ncbi:MAG TPA: RnfABCDGE type electron transport complex subunit D [Thermoanaerobaculia bacterium]